MDTELTQQLICALIPSISEQSNSQWLKQLTAKVKSTIKADTHGGTQREWADTSSSIRGLQEAAGIRVQDDLSDALGKSLRDLDRHRNFARSIWEEDVPIRMENLPQHVYLLLCLAERPTTKTHDFAYEYLRRQPICGPTPEQILYQQIMDEDPFDPGEAWDEEVLNGWTDSESEASGSDDESPAEGEVVTPSSLVVRLQVKRREDEQRRSDQDKRLLMATETIRSLEGRYWKEQKEVEEMRADLYGWKALTTETSVASLAKSLWDRDDSISSKLISAKQLQRELLFALSGRPSIFFSIDATTAKHHINEHHLEVHTLSPRALEGILETIQIYATLASEIRAFVSRIFCYPQSVTSTDDDRKPSRTQQAFTETCRAMMEDFDHWLSSLEASFTLGSMSSTLTPAATPLLLVRELERTHGPLLRHLSSFIPHSHSPTLLLNLIYTTITSVRETNDLRHLPFLYRLFQQTAEPSWRLLGQWIQRGMPVPASLADAEAIMLVPHSVDDHERALDPEFFIERDRDVSWADEDFWENGFVVGDEGWPMWLGQETGELILEAGKAQGLLKSLVGGAKVGSTERWMLLEEVLPAQTSSAGGTDPFGEMGIQEQVGIHLKPMCQLVLYHLRRVLDEECGLDQHLDAIEGTMLLRGFDVIHDWTERLFTKIHQGEQWTDFQILTNSLRQDIDNRGAFWMNPIALRVMTATSQGSETGPRALSALRIDYQVPFPLSQLLTQTSINVRTEIFTFLLQLSMGQWILGKTKSLDRKLLEECHASGEERDVRALWCMRGKILWLLNIVYLWLTERVIEAQTMGFRTRLEQMTSLKSMISLELEHTRRIRDYCFLNPATSELLEAVYAILDMASSISIAFSRRSRQTDRARGSARGGSSDEKDEPHESASLSADASLQTQMKRLGCKLQASVGVLQEGVERLSMERDGEIWAMLSFGLDGWRAAGL